MCRANPRSRYSAELSCVLPLPSVLVTQRAATQRAGYPACCYPKGRWTAPHRQPTWPAFQFIELGNHLFVSRVIHAGPGRRHPIASVVSVRCTSVRRAQQSLESVKGERVGARLVEPRGGRLLRSRSRDSRSSCALVSTFRVMPRSPLPAHDAYHIERHRNGVTLMMRTRGAWPARRGQLGSRFNQVSSGPFQCVFSFVLISKHCIPNLFRYVQAIFELLSIIK